MLLSTAEHTTAAPSSGLLISLSLSPLLLLHSPHRFLLYFSDQEEEMSTQEAVMGWRHPPIAAAEAETGWRQPFTASQWRELEHQALIYKYLVVGVPVPTDLLLPIHRSFQSLYHHYPALGYCSYYGKKLDPEPGRCRRTDGKKWRCSKEAHPESKYCERHMHRGRNRSRKPVESKNNSQPQRDSHSSSSTVTSNVAPGSRSFQNITLQSTVSGVSKPQGLCSSSSGSSLLQLDTKSYETGSKENRNLKFLDGAKVEVDEHNFFSESSGSSRDVLRMNSSMDSSWGLLSAQAFPISKATSDPLILGHSQPHLHAIQYFNEATINTLPKQPVQPYSFFESDYRTPNQGKQECQGPCHFFEWSKARDSWLDLEDEQSKQNYSTTQLSISIPLAPDFSSTTSCSPSDD